MEDPMKKKTAVTVCVVIAIAAVIGAFGWFFTSSSAKSFYYVQVDNTKTTELGSGGRNGVIDFTGGMSLSYTLPAYDKEGKISELSFGTERELRDGAYLCLGVLPLRGVVEWKEIRFDELPLKVQDLLRK